MKDILMPKMGLTMEAGTIVKWNFSVGDVIHKGDELFEIESDKAILPVEAMVEGTLLRILVQNGETTPVLTSVGIVGEPGEKIPDTAAPSSAAASAAPVVAEKQETVTSVPKDNAFGVPATPLARTIAKEKGMDVEAVIPGPDGIVREREVLAASVKPQTKATPVAARMAEEKGVRLSDIPAQGRVFAANVKAYLDVCKPENCGQPEYLIRTHMQDQAAQAVLNTWTTIPMVTNCIELDMSEALKLCDYLNHRYGRQGVKITITDVMLKVLGFAMEHNERANARYENGKIRKLTTFDVGMAAATPSGLCVPVLRDVVHKSILTVNREKAELVEKVRSGKFSPDMFGGASTSLTNMGGYRAEMFTPIINAPESCIFGTGSVKDKAVVVNGQIVIRPMMWLNFTYDHRVLDGEYAAYLLNTVKDLTELPSLFIGYEGGR